MNTVADLIKRLQALPQHMEVVTYRPAKCCCGQCDVLDDYGTALSPEVERVYGMGQDGSAEKVVL